MRKELKAELLAEMGEADAAAHYARAAGLLPSFGILHKAREFSWRAGEYDRALGLGAELVTLAEKGEDQSKHAAALNEHALALRAKGDLDAAEGLFRLAL